MSTYKPKNSKIYKYDFRWQGSRFHGSTGQKTKRAADSFELKVRSEIALGLGRKENQITLDEAAALYEDKLSAEGKWQAAYERWLLDLLTALGPGRYIDEIGQRDLTAYAAKRAGLVSAASVNREIDLWRALWRKTAKSYDIGKMPDWHDMRYSVKIHDPRELTDDEEARLFSHLREDQRDFFAFLLQSGWRVSEVRGLRWADLDFPNRAAVTKIKGGRLIKRPLTSAMVTLLANQKQICPQVFTYICAQSRMKRKKGERYPYSRDGWRKAWAAALSAAGIEQFRPHDLRHTRGTRIVRATGNLAAAQGALAHSNIKTTMRYVHVSDDDVRGALEASERKNIGSQSIPDQRKISK